MTTSRNPSIALSERHRQLIDGLVACGRYQGVSEVVRGSLRLLEDPEAARARALAEIEAVVPRGNRQRPGGRDRSRRSRRRGGAAGRTAGERGRADGADAPDRRGDRGFLVVIFTGAAERSPASSPPAAGRPRPGLSL